MTQKTQAFLDKIYPYILVVGGSLGLLAAFQLTLEKMELLKDSNYVLSCDINPLISCGSVIDSEQSALFGFPNPWLGLVGFAAVIVVGMSLLAGATFKAWYWRLFWLGTLGGAAFIHWLLFQTLYRIGALCPYCMLAWTVTIPIFWYTTLKLLRDGYLLKKTGRAVMFIQNNHFTLLMVWFLIIIGMIIQRFWYYFETFL